MLLSVFLVDFEYYTRSGNDQKAACYEVQTFTKYIPKFSLNHNISKKLCRAIPGELKCETRPNCYYFWEKDSLRGNRCN